MDGPSEPPRKKRKTGDAFKFAPVSKDRTETNGNDPDSASNGLPTSKYQATALAESRKLLPIWPGRDAIVNAVKNNESVVIIGEPGSGKTTQVPQYLLDAGLVAAQGLIAVTQPRKVAATTIAARVAAERSTQVGSEVGYAIRFDDTSSPHTRIKFYTDGMLLREMLNDPQLKKCDVVIVDEAHERTLRTDVLLANLKRIQKTRGSASTSASAEQSNGKRSERRDRRPLKIIVMSASLQAERFSNYLGGAPILYVKGRQHPVKLYFSKEHQDDYLDSALRTFFQIHDEKEQGDVLIFLPGQEDIEGLASTIRLYANQQPPDRLQVLVRPLYAALSVAKQHEAFLKAPPNTRKCVLATNIAETSVTIPGIRFVIDTGLCNEKRYLTANKGPGVERLAVSAISKSSAIQRAGRAGRDGPGKCFRLYTEASYQELEPSPLPEVKRCDLTFAVLQQQSFGYDIEHLDLMDQPALSSVKKSKLTLLMLGALDQSWAITAVGKAMAKLPLEPHLARAVIESRAEGCTKEIVDIVSILSASSKVFFDPPTEDRETAQEARAKFFHPSGDHLTLLNVFRAFDEISAHAVDAVAADSTKKDLNTNGVKSSSSSSGFSKSGRKDWCRRMFVNERALNEAIRIRDQIKRSCQQSGMDPNLSCGEKYEPILKSLFRGLVHHNAMRQADDSYKNTALLTIKIHPSSVLCDKRPQSFMYEELVLTSFPYARCVSSIPPSWQSEWSQSFRKSIP